ncbi:hypothetical protein ILYODFUR_005633 [Ilyodon furcidens]|uniref:Uncharacterized protein n=1 Tax=Ilyodon furcidens TaxID=33524 RepID=A0ABV0U4R7_9TELE
MRCMFYPCGWREGGNTDDRVEFVKKADVAVHCVTLEGKAIENLRGIHLILFLRSHGSLWPKAHYSSGSSNGCTEATVRAHSYNKQTAKGSTEEPKPVRISPTQGRHV